MDWDLKITDMAGATPEHSAVIVNFVAAIRYQLKNSTCYVYSDNVQYRFKQNQDVETLLQMRRVLLWKFCHHQQKIMTGQRKCSYIVNRRLKSIGLLTGVKEQLKSMN